MNGAWVALPGATTRNVDPFICLNEPASIVKSSTFGYGATLRPTPPVLNDGGTAAATRNTLPAVADGACPLMARGPSHRFHQRERAASASDDSLLVVSRPRVETKQECVESGETPIAPEKQWACTHRRTTDTVAGTPALCSLTPGS